MISDFSKENFFLSNFYNAYLDYEGVVFCSTEAAFQAAKTLDIEERKKIARMSPSESKRQAERLRSEVTGSLSKTGLCTMCVSQNSL